MNGIFTTFTNSRLTLLRGCMRTKPRMFLLHKPVLCTFLTDWFSLEEYLLEHSEIWLCNDSFFFSFRGREYAFEDCEQARSRTGRQRAARLGAPEPGVWGGASLVVCDQLGSCRQCPSKGWMCPALSSFSGQRIPQPGFIQPHLCDA